MKKKLLIIDDEPDMRDWLVELAQDIGFDTDQAASAEEALAKVEKNRFDLILCDVRLGKISGLEFLKMFRKHNNSTPVFIMTGFDEVSEHQVYLLKGNGLFYKPINPEALSQFLEEHL